MGMSEDFFKALKFMVVEDVDRDREEVLNQLADAGFQPENSVALPATFQDALEALTDHAEQLDVVFLDLNLPRNADDASPEKRHGRKLLETIHNTFNPRLGIRVVVVSGEDLLDGFNDQNMYDAWPGTLVSIAQKSALSKTLSTSLKRLRKDPLAQRIRRAKVDGVLDYYETVVDATKPIGERLKAARSLAVRLVRNEVDQHLSKVNGTSDYADNLNGLIHDHIESRFAPGYKGRQFIDIGKIESEGGWSAFLWRGATVQHLYVLNHYRNDHTHIDEKPYGGGSSEGWTIPRETMERLKAGSVLGQIAECIVRELLDWYLPWHEQVYRPWLEKQK
jgi:CheY-like chemotaxis protein